VAIAFQGFDRITADPGVLGGKPVIRGMRLSVQRVLEILAQNPSWEELRLDYPELDAEDIRQALAFAAASLGDRVLPLPPLVPDLRAGCVASVTDAAIRIRKLTIR
jgi:uncharacterized protein (DUF433 family)